MEGAVENQFLPLWELLNILWGREPEVWNFKENKIKLSILWRELKAMIISDKSSTNRHAREKQTSGYLKSPDSWELQNR